MGRKVGGTVSLRGMNILVTSVDAYATIGPNYVLFLERKAAPLLFGND